MLELSRITSGMAHLPLIRLIADIFFDVTLSGYLGLCEHGSYFGVNRVSGIKCKTVPSFIVPMSFHLKIS